MKLDNSFRYFLTMVIATLILSSCAKLPIVASHWHEEAMDSKNNFSHYDTKSGLRYMVSNDDTHLYVSFDTHNPGIQMNIMRSGARISVDTNGKKKGTAYMKYPLIDRQQMQERGERGTHTEGEQTGAGRQRPGMQGGGAKMPMKAIFVDSQEQYAFDNMIDKTDFKTILIRDSLDVLYYMVGIPLKKIHPDGLEGIHNLAVGIEIESTSSPSRMGGSPSGSVSMGGGGRSGGRMTAGGGRSGGGRPGGGQSSEPGMPAQANPVKIWFETNLYRNN